MATKTVDYNKTGVGKLPVDKPVLYRIKTGVGKTSYVGIAKRGRAQERIHEHLDAGAIPGAKVQIEQASSITEARRREMAVIARSTPKYNQQKTR